MTIYIDIIILENIIMNCIILYATALILKCKVSYVKIILASILGALYSALQYITKLSICSNILLKSVLSILMVYIAYNPKKVKVLLKELLVFYLTTFTFGGVATYLIYVLKPENVIIRNGLFVGTYVLKVVFIGAIIGTIILIMAFKISKNKLSKKDMFCKIKIKLNGKEKILNAMIDTGNMLKEPLTGNSVVVIERTSLYDLLPKEILNNTESILGGDLEKIPENLKDEYVPRLKIIPFSSLGKQNGMLVGIKAEKLEILDDERKKERNDAIIGIYDKSLTKRGEYNALIGIELY